MERDRTQFECNFSTYSLCKLGFSTFFCFSAIERNGGRKEGDGERGKREKEEGKRGEGKRKEEGRFVEKKRKKAGEREGGEGRKGNKKEEGKKKETKKGKVMTFCFLTVGITAEAHGSIQQGPGAQGGLCCLSGGQDKSPTPRLWVLVCGPMSCQCCLAQKRLSVILTLREPGISHHGACDSLRYFFLVLSQNRYNLLSP